MFVVFCPKLQHLKHLSLEKPVKLSHWLHLSDTVHVVVTVKGALSKLIWLHGEVEGYQGVEGFLQLCQRLRWEGCEEGQHQQGLTLHRWEKPARETHIASFALISSSNRKSKARAVMGSNLLHCLWQYLEIQWQILVNQQRSESGKHRSERFMADIGADRGVDLMREREKAH